MPEDRYLNAGDLRIRYWAAGNRGTPVVLLHGLAASCDVWMHNIEALAGDYRVYAPDLPGFGWSERPGPSFSPLDYASFLEQFLDALAVGRVAVVGQSMGGGIALRHALRFPERVGKIVLSDSAGLGREVIWTLRWMSLPMVGELFSHPTRKGVEFALNLAVGNRVPITRDFVQLHYRFFRQPGYGKFFLKILRGMVTIKGAREETIAPIIRDLHKIEQPVLIIWGEQDRVLPLKHAYVAERNLPRATLKIFDKCGHLPFFEQPEEFNRIVLEFLSE